MHTKTYFIGIEKLVKIGNTAMNEKLSTLCQSVTYIHENVQTIIHRRIYPYASILIIQEHVYRRRYCSVAATAVNERISAVSLSTSVKRGYPATELTNITTSWYKL